MSEQQERITNEMTNAAFESLVNDDRWLSDTIPSRHAVRSALEAVLEAAPSVRGWIVCGGRPMTNFAHAVLSPESCSYEHHLLMVGPSTTYLPIGDER